MATDQERLILSLEAQYRRLQKDMDKALGIANDRTRKLENRYAQSNKAIARSTDQMSRQVAASYNAAAKSALRNTSEIKSALLASASAIATGFGVQEIANLADGYTRFTNQLVIAGLKGEDLAKTQEDLFAVGQKYGVQIEGLATLYGGLSNLQKDLNTTSQDSLQLTSAVAAAIKVSGASAEKAAGAILGLNQALAQTRVQSDEYNQILDGARPLLLAAVKASDKYGGSLAKLKQDIEAGNVSGQKLFQILKAGFPGLAAQAEKANLTIANSFTILNNALGKYIGETDASLSATQRVSQGIQTLANNLDKIVPALGVIIAFIGVRYAAAGATFIATEVARQAALVRSTLATEAATAANAQYALVGLRASATAASMTASVSAQSVAMGVAAGAARTTGAALLSAFGGPIGLTILAVTAAIAGLVAIENKAISATEEYTSLAAAGAKALRGYESAAYAAAVATGEQAKKAREAAATARAEAVEHQNAAKKKLESARASLALAKAEQARAGSSLNFQVAGGFSAGANVSGQGAAAAAVKQAQANIALADAAVKAAESSIAASDRILNAKPTAAGATGESPADKKKRLAAERKAAAEAKKLEAARIADVRDDKAFDAALRQAEARLVNARADAADVAEERLRVETEGLEAERQIKNREIAAEGPAGTKRYSDAQVRRLQALNDQAADQEKANLLLEHEARVQREAVQQASEAISRQVELLQYQRDLATTTAERYAIERRILALTQQEERDRLQAIIDSKDPSVTAGDRASARSRLQQLPQIESAQRELLYREQRDAMKESILGAFEAAKGGAKGLADYFGDQIKAKLLDGLATSIANAILGARQAGGGSGGFGGILKSLGGAVFGGLKIPGFASGTPYAPGGLAYVHKDELIQLPRGSKVNTATQTAAMIRKGMPGAGRAGGIMPVTVSMSVDVAGARGDAQLVELVTQAAQAATGEALRQANRAAPGRQISYAKLGK